MTNDHLGGCRGTPLGPAELEAEALPPRPRAWGPCVRTVRGGGGPCRPRALAPLRRGAVVRPRGGR